MSYGADGPGPLRFQPGQRRIRRAGDAGWLSGRDEEKGELLAIVGFENCRHEEPCSGHWIVFSLKTAFHITAL